MLGFMSLTGRATLTGLVMVVALSACNRAPEETTSSVESQNSQSPIDGPTTVTGLIKDSSGQPVAGALVKVNGTDTGLGYMVVSQADGSYATPELIPGKYIVHAIGGTFESNTSEPVEVNKGSEVQADRVLDSERVIPPPVIRMTNADYAKLMPEGDAKLKIIATCTRCHGLDRVVPARKSPPSWQITIDRMTYFLAGRPDLGGAVPEQDKQAILEYVSTHFTRDAPRVSEPEITHADQYLPAELLTGEQARFLAMTFNPPVDVDGINETEFGLDAQGNVWISEVDTPYFGKLDTATLTYTRHELPAGKFERMFGQIAPDPEGRVWLVDNGPSPAMELHRYDPASREVKTYLIKAPLRYRAPLNTLRFLDGNVWGTGNASSRIIKVDPRTGEVTEYPTPRGAHPFGIDIGADQAVWYLTNYNNEIVRLDPATGEQTSYRPATRQAGLRRMGADALGNIWAGAQDANILVKLDSRTGTVTEYKIPTTAGEPYSVDVDKTRNLVWFSERGADKLGRFDPATETFVEFPLPAAGIEATRILVDPVNPNRIWWNCTTGCSVGYLEVLE